MLVNPGPAPASVALGATMKRVDHSGGGAIDADGTLPGTIRTVPVDRLVVPGHGAEILLK